MSSSNIDKHYYGIDLLKFIAAICVVIIHTNPHKNAGLLFANLCDFVIRCAVPYFFIVSAFLLFSKSDNRQETEVNIKRYCIHILKLYLVWSAIYLPIGIYGRIVIYKQSFSKILIHSIKSYLLVGEQWYSWPLWYLLATFYGALLLYIMYRCNLSEKAIIALGMVIYLFSFFINYVGEHGEKFAYISELISKTIVNGRLLSGMGYMVAGLLLARLKYRLPALVNYLIIAIGLIVTILSSWTGIVITYTPLLLIVVVAIFGIAEALNGSKKETCIFLRNMSTVIYFTHMIWLFLGGILIWGFKDAYGSIPFIWTIGLSIIFSFLIVKYCWKSRLAKVLFK